jgi:FkbM family methyltransferase
MRILSAALKRLKQSPELLAARWQTPLARQVAMSYLNMGTVKFPMDIPLRNGAVVRVYGPGEVKVFWQIFIHRCYRLWADCRTIVDAGANIGMFSVWAALQLPQSRILALEPFPETFARLQHNIRTNQLEGRVETVQWALAAESGERAMPAVGESQRRSLIPDDQGLASETSVRVKSRRLSDLLDQYNLGEIDLLKMDIEGSEWEVLLSTPPSVFRTIRRIQLEYHEVHARFGYSKPRLFDHLRSAGYRLTYCQEDEQHTGIAIVEQESTSASGKPLKIPYFSKVRRPARTISPV